MHDGGFSHRKPRSPATLVGVVAIHAGVIAALVLIRSDYVPKINGSFPIAFYPAPKPIQPPPQTQAKASNPVATSRPLPPDANDSVIIQTRTADPIILAGAPDGVPVTSTLPKLDVPIPVLVEAAPDPRFARDFQPPYPPAKQRLGEEGRVVLRVLVGTDGRVKATEILASDDDAFSTVTVRQALGRWRFRPATRDGVAVETWRTLTVRFEMNG